MLRFNLTLAFIIFLSAITSHAQSSSFTYQGKLNDNNAAANGTYEMQFSLFDENGNQIGTTNIVNNVSVSNGIFTVRITFGTLAFDGNPRFLEIGVRPAGSQNPFTILAPRQSVLSSPYSIRSLTAATADLALNSNQLGGIAANQYVLTNDARMSDARDPLPGSGNYIQNTTSAQLLSNFNISGEGKANIFSAATQFNIGANRVLTANSTRGIFAGIGAGQSNTTGDGNSFFGKDSGFANTTGNFNSFFGLETGLANTTGSVNSFFGSGSGRANTIGINNAFYGADSGRLNTSGEDNTFVGSFSGRNNTIGTDNSFFGILSGNFNSSGNGNSFFGAAAGYNTTSGNSNSFFGRDSGGSNTTGVANTFIGINAGFANTTGSNNTLLGSNANLGANNLTFAAAIGADAVVNANNTIVLGRAADTVQIPGSLNIAGTFGANIFNAATQYNLGGNRVLSIGGTNNLFGGIGAGAANSGGQGNAFFGISAGTANTSGSWNAFFGFNAGAANTTAVNNSFFGQGAGFKNTTGQDNTFVGNGSGQNNTTAGNNSFVGSLAGFNNTTGANNTFFGFNAGNVNNGGGANTFIGVNAGIANVGSSNNTFLGANAGNTNLTGSGNTYLGANSDGATLITNAVAIGQKAYVGQSNALVLGSINGVNTATADTNVGIGTTTPQSRLQIVNNTDNSFLVESNSGKGAGIELKGTGTNGENWIIYASNNGNVSTSGLYFFNKTTNLSPLRISDGITYFSQLSQFDASVRLLNLGTNGDVALCRSSSNNIISTCSSSRRYKKDIQPFQSGLSLLNQLNPVTFRWKSNDKQDLGFVAEDVAKIEPLLTTTNDSGEVEGVKYDRISAILVNAVKEQQEQIKEQQEQIKLQQQQIDALKKLVCLNNKEADACKEQQQ